MKSSFIGNSFSTDKKSFDYNIRNVCMKIFFFHGLVPGDELKFTGTNHFLHDFLEKLIDTGLHTESQPEFYPNQFVFDDFHHTYTPLCMAHLKYQYG